MQFSGAHFFGLSCLAGTLAYAALALDAGACASALLVPFCALAYATLVMASNPATRWHGDLLAWSVVAACVVALATYVFRGWFDRWRAPRVLAVASLIPVTAYLVRAMS